jgi:hypothetical protein
MRFMNTLPLLTLCLAGSMVMAQDRNCSDLSDPQARQECLKRKTSAEADCSNVADAQARRECAQHKQQNSADCSKLATAELRQRCARQKAK